MSRPVPRAEAPIRYVSDDRGRESDARDRAHEAGVGYLSPQLSKRVSTICLRSWIDRSGWNERLAACLPKVAECFA